MSVSGKHSTTHPAPHRDKVSSLALLAGLVGAPAAWVTQMTSSEVLSAYSCYPYQIPLHAPLWGRLTPMLTLISLLCFAGSLLSLLLVRKEWRRMKPHDAKHNAYIVEINQSRTRFVIKLGAMSNFIFITAIVFTACANIFVSPCSRWF